MAEWQINLVGMDKSSAAIRFDASVIKASCIVEGSQVQTAQLFVLKRTHGNGTLGMLMLLAVMIDMHNEAPVQIQDFGFETMRPGSAGLSA